jgi:glycolate oxidase
MNEVRAVDAAQRVAWVEPGVLNLDLSRAVAHLGLHYAPDPSSQQACSIGGNVATNAGGPHCLASGVTATHVLALDVVLADGSTATLGGLEPDQPGYDLRGCFVGSEGTMGIATRIAVKLTPNPPAVRTLLLDYTSIDDAAATVSGIIAAGIVPAAVEMMDALAIEAAEAAVHPHYPDAGAVLIVELDGPEAEVEHQFAEVERICRAAGASEIRIAADDAERALFWKGRKSAFAAVGRISPDYIVQDGVIPRTALPEVLRRIGEISASRGVRVANVFHAGDGNLHPLVLFDDAVDGEAERAEKVSAAILDLCIEYGGSITGEHGVGMDKAKHMPRMFSDDDLDTMQLVRCAFDPDNLSNPGKVFPTPRLCGEVPGRHKGAHPLQEAGLAEVF